MKKVIEFIRNLLRPTVKTAIIGEAPKVDLVGYTNMDLIGLPSTFKYFCWGVNSDNEIVADPAVIDLEFDNGQMASIRYFNENIPQEVVMDHIESGKYITSYSRKVS